MGIFLAVRFLVGNEKNMGHLSIPKSQKVLEKVENSYVYGYSLVIDHCTGSLEDV